MRDLGAKPMGRIHLSQHEGQVPAYIGSNGKLTSGNG